MKRLLTIAFALILSASALSAQEQASYYPRQAEWLEMAYQMRPVLHETVVRPVGAVRAVQDTAAYQGWRYEPCEGWGGMENRSFREIKEITLDFGKHYTGYFTFRIKSLRDCMDGPIRLRFLFGEMPSEMNTPLDPWPEGCLSRGWMQEEILTIINTDQDITLPRRMSFRYLKIELLGTSQSYTWAIDHISFKAVSSAGEVKTSLQPGAPQIIQDINRVSIETLRECMQTFFEDGPKRDHRLWIGDLYLQSLANAYSFQNWDLVRRCLYIFAALADPTDGRLHGNVFEDPMLHPQYQNYMLTYALLYNSTLLQYIRDTGDLETARDLWPVAHRQVEDALFSVGDDYIFDMARKPSWCFIDWRDGLDVAVCVQGAVIFGLEETYAIAEALGCTEDVKEWPKIAAKMKKAAYRRYFDKSSGMFLSNGQTSVQNQMWMVMAGVPSAKEGAAALRNALSSENALKPGTPYATHYLVEAMLRCGMNDEAHDYLVDYWGGMVRKGADTFWEAYDPDNDHISPYGFTPVNSACHAWSCTPVYFIHKYPEIFQK